MILLQVQQVARYFGADTLFENVSLDVSDNSRIALVGRNGVGKSTLLKMIIGNESPDAGQITKKKGLTIGYLAQNTGLESDKTIYAEMLSVFERLQIMEKNLHEMETKIADPGADHSSSAYSQLLNQYDQLLHDFEEQNGYGYEAEVRSVLHGFHFEQEDYDRKISSLSGGQKTRLALAKLLLEQRDLLILDEPTNHLDIDTLTWLEGYVQNYKGALLIVSHDRYFLDRIVNEVYEISHHHSSYYKGNYSAYIDQKAERLRQDWKNYEKQQAEISKLEDFVNKNLVRASTTKRAQSRRKQLEKMERLERPEGDEKGPHFKFTADSQSGNIVLTVKDAAIGYDGRIISSPINIDLRKNQVMAIVGPNGIGKSTLLKSVLGQIPFVKGSSEFGTNVKVGYYDQEQHNLHDKKTVLNELWDDHPTTPEKDIRSILGSFLFIGDDVSKVVHNLSGGEKARLLLTKLAMKHDNFLILDEPTNHLDIDSKEVLENAVMDFNGTVLFVSHDRYFINKVATCVLEIAPQGSTLYLGDYDYYLEKKAEQEEIAAAKSTAETPIENSPKEVSTGKVNYQQGKERQKQERRLKRSVEEFEQLVEKLDAQKNDLENQMSSPENYNDLEKMGELQAKLQEISKKLAEAEENWEQASMELEEFLA
ncbi:ABC-F type ribosomal protection protein [Ligilactobacillus ruminis]|uniref:ABC transporter ATP-binding protein n=1 Tax=Ligilactobacillus ruminis TaxID=1623 RepID=UPI00232B4348|nr:ABC-F type ribosomal protection protein [Ligilactobacillus ruminis]MDB7641373.1 ABC-F type ribosomal protection protein [Ligilactobacillus ruminis]MDB7645811.1 ABC-F type ribosomal protection protein [Ligilactobacillus ruminis]MDB7648056.1 ABC-F type ribosomal protection protein [Ligilactobacillus ruminis]